MLFQFVVLSDTKVKEEAFEAADAKLMSIRLKKDPGELEKYHPLLWDETMPRPSIHRAIYQGNVNAVGEILKQNKSEQTKSDQIADELTEILSSHSGAEKQQNLTELSSDDRGASSIRSRSLLSGESFEKFIPHSILDSQCFTPLHLSASLDFASVGSGVPAEITRMLLSAGADVKCVDKYGNTALHWAARSGNGDVAHLLTLKNCSLGKYGIRT
jgi:ankyrin repeat protein